MRVTYEMLINKKACTENAEKFRERWPDGAETTAENFVEAQRINLNLEWFAESFLTATALDAYHQATAPALAACEQAKATALAKFFEEMR